MQGSVVQVLQADYASIERLLASAMQGLADQTAASGSGGTISDKCELMEAMHENHLNIMPRVDACEAALAAFCQRCIDDKVGAPLTQALRRRQASKCGSSPPCSAPGPTQRLCRARKHSIIDLGVRSLCNQHHRCLPSRLVI